MRGKNKGRRGLRSLRRQQKSSFPLIGPEVVKGEAEVCFWKMEGLGQGTRQWLPMGSKQMADPSFPVLREGLAEVTVLGPSLSWYLIFKVSNLKVLGG